MSAASFHLLSTNVPLHAVVSIWLQVQHLGEVTLSVPRMAASALLFLGAFFAVGLSVLLTLVVAPDIFPLTLLAGLACLVWLASEHKMPVVKVVSNAAVQCDLQSTGREAEIEPCSTPIYAAKHGARWHRARDCGHLKGSTRLIEMTACRTCSRRTVG